MGGMKVFWTEGSGRVPGKKEEHTSGGCLSPRAKLSSDGSDPPSIALSRPRALSLLALSLYFAGVAAQRFQTSQILRGEIQTLVHWHPEDSTRIYGRTDGIYRTNAREKAATASFTVMNASS